VTLAASGLWKSYGDVPVLREVSFAVGARERAALVGASGSGKSTLLRLVAGFDRPDAGSVSLDGRTLVDGRACVPAHRRGIGYVAQDGALFPHLTVRQNVAFGLPRGGGRGERVRETLELVGLDGALVDRYPHALSGGQQQRVALRGRWPRGRRRSCSTSRSAPWTPASASRRAEPWWRRSSTPASPPSWSRTTRRRRCPSGTRWACCPRASCSSGASRPPCSTTRPPPPSRPSSGPRCSCPRTATAPACARPWAGSRCVTTGAEGSAGGAGAAVRAMVRPAQVQVRTDAARDGNATLRTVAARGAETEVVLVCDDPAQPPLVLRQPAHALAGALPGARVLVTVSGGVVVYATT
jgi:iron(III) transport system ATP-binding protein